MVAGRLDLRSDMHYQCFIINTNGCALRQRSRVQGETQGEPRLAMQKQIRTLEAADGAGGDRSADTTKQNAQLVCEA